MGTGQRGTFQFGNIPFLDYSAMQTPFGTLTRPGGRVIYVRSAVASGDPWGLKKKLIPTLDEALKQCRANENDTVFILPGHTENVAAADAWSNLAAGTQIIGLGTGTDRPTFTWSAAASTVLFNVANVRLSNCILEMSGPSGTTAITVANGIYVTGAGCTIDNCLIHFGIDADQKTTLPINTSAAADGLNFSFNQCYGATAAECTAFMDVIGVDRLQMVGNYIAGATSNVAVGLLRFATTASLDIYLKDNVYINRKALSTCAVTGLAAVSGISILEHFAYLDTASLTPWLTSRGIMHFHRPTVTNTAAETGSEVVGTVSA